MTPNAFKISVLGFFAVVTPLWMFGQVTASGAAEATTIKIDLNLILATIMLALLIPLFLTAQTFTLSVKRYLKEIAKSDAAKSAGLLLLFMFASQMVFAQTAPAAAQPSMFEAFDLYTWALLFVIGLEILVISLASNQANTFLTQSTRNAAAEAAAAVPAAKTQTWWERINQFRPLEEEANMDAGHDYDGIRELDNITPPWFTAGFVMSIIFAIIYMWRYHIAEAAPLQLAEYKAEMAEAAIEDAVRLAGQANKVDESNVKMLGGIDIEQGKALFVEKCTACHGANGASAPGGVGPNLTDNHWLHGGSIKDVFKSVKYGWPEKGMIAWQEQLSPHQIAQITSFIMSVKGSNPAGAKEPQGDVYVESEK